MLTDPARTLVRLIQRRPRMMQLVMRVAAAGLLAAPAAAQTGGVVTATTPILNHARAQFTSDGSAVTATDSSLVSVTIVVGVRLDGSGEAALAPGQQAVFAHTLANTGQRADAFALAALVPAGWRAEILHDVDADGQLGAGDTVVTTASLLAGGTMPLLVRVTAPAAAPDSSVATLRVTATSRRAAAATSFAEDRATIRWPRSTLTLTLEADREVAAHGDTVSYVAIVRNIGEARSDTITVLDTLPSTMGYVTGTLTLGGRVVQDSVAAFHGSSRHVLKVGAAPLAPGESHAIGFDVVLGTGASTRTQVNTALVLDGPVVAALASDDLRIAIAELRIEKSIVGDTLVPLGGSLTYRLTYTNTSSVVTAREVTLTDSLLDELQFVSAEANPTVNGQVVSWTLEPLVPGASGTRDLTVRAVRLPAVGNIVNHASINALNAVASSATASRVVVNRAAGSALGITKSAGVLEARLGEAVPYLVTIRNKSVVPISGIVVHDLLPDGMQLAGRNVRGADSVRVSGRSVTLHVSGPLAPGAEVTLRYNGVVMSGMRAGAMTNVVTASADDGRISADTATATVRLRRGYELENRTLVGKVWIDRNDDGRQDAGELGVSGVEIWSADGSAVVTDREGRFSLRDVQPGQHALRLDMMKVPRGLRLSSPDADLVVVRSDGWTLPQVEFRLVPTAGEPTCICPDTQPRRRQAADVARADAEPAAATAPDSTRDSQAFLRGPGVRFIAPAARAVIHASRVYVGVKGEPNMPVRLYDGDSLLVETLVRGDGQQDFIGVALSPGPHRLRAWTRNSWNNERWDSISVHRSGPAAGFELEPGTPPLHPDAKSDKPVRVRVVDRWSMPVARGTQVTIEAAGVVLEGDDTDKSSVGLQRMVGEDGWISLPMRGGKGTGRASLKLRSGAARGGVSLSVLPLIRPLMVMGAAEVGVGAADAAYGAVTARGAIAERTSVSVSYDTRRGGEDEPFARAVDPMQATQYPTVGDGSRQRSSGLASGALSARVERDYDWLEFGDVTPQGLGGSGKLFDYHRALTGVQGRVDRGTFSAQGFGTLTRQQLQERQLRATRGSGPYALGTDLRPGTERVTLEVRARENTARIVARTVLARTADYEIDYETGVLLLRRPIAEMDAEGNPVFIVALVESRGGGDTRLVGGGRAELGVGRWIPRTMLDSMSVAVTGIHDASGGAAGAIAVATPSALNVLGADARILRGGFGLELEHMRTTRRDTSADANRVALTWTDRADRFTSGAQWLRVTPGFGNGLDPRLAAGVQELRLSAGYRVRQDARVEIGHERQLFRQYDVERQNTFVRARRRFGERELSQELGLTRDGALGGTSSTIGRGRLELTASARTSMWLEGTRNVGNALRLGPERIGMGAGYRLFGATRVEGTHFLNTMPGVGTYTTTAMNLRTETLLGGRAWGGVERASAGRSSHSALLGIEQRIPLRYGWEVQSMYERRVGLDEAPLRDEARALPFPQQERDRSALALGLAFLPGGDRPNMTLRAERHTGMLQSGTRVTLAGDAALGRDAALLARSDWSQFTHTAGTISTSRNDRSLLGYAFRPTASNTLNMLAKAEWRRSRNPMGTATLADSAEQRRLIGASDLVWTPLAHTEIALRYAMRWSEWRQVGVATPESPLAHYSGLRAERRLVGRLSARVDGRLLMEQSSGTTTWSAAPSLLYRVSRELRVEAGYRAGTLRDVDFGMGPGRLFATMGLQFTERTLASPLSFWRERLANEH